MNRFTSAIDDPLLLSANGRLALTSMHDYYCPDLAKRIQRLAQDRPIHAVECRGVEQFVCDRLVSVLSCLPSITALEFANQNVTDEQIDELLELPELEDVRIIRSQALTARGAQALNARGLTRLEIIGCPNIGKS